MSMIYVFFKTIFLFIYLDAVTADYPANVQKRPVRIQGKKFSNVYWPNANFNKDNTLDRKTHVSETEHNIWKVVDNEIGKGQNNQVPNNAQGNSRPSLTQLVTRARLATTLKAVFEEMIQLISEDIEKTNKLVLQEIAPSKDPENYSTYLQRNKKILDENEMNIDPKLNVANGWMEGTQNKQQVDRTSQLPENYIIKKIRKPNSYRIVTKFQKKQEPNKVLLTYNNEGPHIV